MKLKVSWNKIKIMKKSNKMNKTCKLVTQEFQIKLQ